MRLLVATFILMPLLAFCQSMTTPGVGQLPQKFDTIAQLVARPGTNYQTVLVRGYSSVGDWGPERQARFIPGTGSSTNRGCDFATTGGRWHFPDCDTEDLDVRWFGGDPNTKTNASDLALQSAIDVAASPAYLQSGTPFTNSTSIYSRDVVLVAGNWCIEGPIYMKGPTVRGKNAAGSDANAQTLIWHKQGSTNSVFVATNYLYSGGIRDLRMLGHKESNYSTKSIVSVGGRMQFTVAPADIPALPTIGDTKFCFFLSPSNTYVGSARIYPPNRTTGVIDIEPGWDNYASETQLLTTSYKVVFAPTMTADPPFESIGTVSEPMLAGPVAIDVKQAFNFRINNVDIRLFHSGIRIGANSSLQCDELIQVDRSAFANIGRAFPSYGSDNQIASCYLTGTYQQDYNTTTDSTVYLNSGFRNTLFGWYIMGATDDIGTLKSDRCVYGLYYDRGADSTIGRLLIDRPISGGIYVQSSPTSPSASSGHTIGDAIIRGSTDTNLLATNVIRAAITISTNVIESFDLSIGRLRVPTFDVWGDYTYVWNISTNVNHNVFVGNVLEWSGATNWTATIAAPFLESGGPTTASAARNGWYSPAYGNKAWAKDGIQMFSTSNTVFSVLGSAVQLGDPSLPLPGVDIRGGASGSSVLALFTRTGLNTYGLGSANGAFTIWDASNNEVIGAFNRNDTNTVNWYIGRISQPNNARSASLYSDLASGTDIAATRNLALISPLGTGAGAASGGIAFYTPTNGITGTSQHTPILRAYLDRPTASGTALSIQAPSGLQRVLSSNGVLNIGLTGGTAANFYRGDGKFTNIYVNANGSSVTLPNFIDSIYIQFATSGNNIYALPLNSGVVAGTYSNPSLTVDVKGRITNISSGSAGDEVTVNGSATSNPNFKDGSNITFGLSGSDVTADLTATGVAAASYTYAGGSVTVDAKGRVTGASSGLSPYQIVRGYITNGANVTITDTGTNISISATTGGSTNGTPLYVDTAGPLATANLADSTEVNPAASGTNVTFSIVTSSLATNKINSTFYNLLMAPDVDTATNILVNGTLVSLANLQNDTGAGGINWAVSGSNIKAYATNVTHGLSFTNGLTNSANVVQWAVSPGANITLTTNNGQITIAAATGVTNSGTGVSVDSGALLVYANLINSSEVDPSVSGTNVSFAIVNNSLETNRLTTNAFIYLLNRANHLNTQPWTTIDSTPTTLGGYGIVNAQLTNTTLTRLGGIGPGTAGDIIYRDATGWTNLAKGTDGDVLTLASGYPNWEPPTVGSSGGYLEKSVTQVGFSNTLDPVTLYTWTIPGDTLSTDGDELEIYVPADYTCYNGITAGYTWTFYKEADTGSEGSVATLYSNPLSNPGTVETFASDWSFRLKRMTSTNAFIILKHTVGSNTGTNVLANTVRVMNTTLENGGWGVDTDFRLTVQHGVDSASHITRAYGYTVRKLR